MLNDTESSPLLDTGQDDEIPVRIRPSNEESYVWNVMCYCLNTLVHLLMGANVIVTLWFAFMRMPSGPMQQHIALCVIGYQLLMAQGMLSLSNYNGWSRPLRIVNKRRVHWILQLAGSALSVTGSIIMMREKTVHFNTTHGKLGFAALVFTCISLVNGLSSLYATELRRFVPPSVSKLSHICLGAAAFAVSTACLCFGFKKRSFQEWATAEIAYLLVVITSTYTIIVVFVPLLKFAKNLVNILKNRLFA